MDRTRPDNAHSSYDELPYESEPFPESHPARIAAVGALFGLAVKAPADSRVLEIGCAGGNNLLPLAAEYPSARLVGVEMSGTQLDEARERIRRVGLTNLELIQGDIQQRDIVDGTFDYIIAHGFFSWVGPEVQERLLELIAERLSPDGIAYVSFNALPGWYDRLPARELLLMQLDGVSGARRRVEEARRIIRVLLETPSDAFDEGLSKQLRFYESFPDWYLFHDILEAANHPIYLATFARRAARHGLRYVGDSDLSRMVPFDLPAAVQRLLRKEARSDLQLEQLLDFARNEPFRRAILCRRERQPDRNGAANRLDTLFFSRPAVADNAHADHHVGARGRNIKVEDSVSLAILTTLDARSPERVGLRSLAGAVAADATFLADHLFKLLLVGLVEAHVDSGLATAVAGDRPSTTALIRDYASMGTKVVNLRHELLMLEEPVRAMLASLDGTRSAEELCRTEDGSSILQSLVRSACIMRPRA